MNSTRETHFNLENDGDKGNMGCKNVYEFEIITQEA